MFANHTSNTGFPSRKYKEFLKIDGKNGNNKNNAIRKQTKDTSSHLTGEDIQIVNKHTEEV